MGSIELKTSLLFPIVHDPPLLPAVEVVLAFTVGHLWIEVCVTPTLICSVRDSRKSARLAPGAVSVDWDEQSRRLRGHSAIARNCLQAYHLP